jgi:hypothetical protein
VKPEKHGKDAEKDVKALTGIGYTMQQRVPSKRESNLMSTIENISLRLYQCFGVVGTE